MADKFAASHMVNKDVNIDTEVRPKMLKDTSILKKLTGSHPVWVQEKGEKGFDATCMPIYGCCEISSGSQVVWCF
jgi:phage/plasmid-associated DNA primase